VAALGEGQVQHQSSQRRDGWNNTPRNSRQSSLPKRSSARKILSRNAPAPKIFEQGYSFTIRATFL